jgi:hypothetical protein
MTITFQRREGVQRNGFGLAPLPKMIMNQCKFCNYYHQYATCIISSALSSPLKGELRIGEIQNFTSSVYIQAPNQHFGVLEAKAASHSL